MNTLQWIEDTAFSDWVLTSIVGFPLMLSLHAVGMAVSVGLILVFSLRLLGLFKFVSHVFLRRALPVAWAGLAVNFLSGTALFAPRGVEYVGDPAFLTKMVLIVLGVANTRWLHSLLTRNGTSWDEGRAVPAISRVAAAATILIWFGTVASGRLIAYVS